MDFIYAIIAGLFGGALVFIQAGGSRYVNWRRPKDAFTAAIALWAGYIAWLGSDANGLMDVASALAVFTIFAVMWTLPRGQALSGPSQSVPDNEKDPLFKVVAWVSRTIFRRSLAPGVRLGWGAWLGYGFMHWTVPMIAVSMIVGNAAPAVAGAAIPFVYWPVAYRLMKAFPQSWQDFLVVYDNGVRTGSGVEFVSNGLAGTTAFTLLACGAFLG